MIFNKHYDLKGQHAYLSASQYHWLNYDEEKLSQTYMNYLAVERGTRLHALAESMIREGIKAQKSKATFNMYVNDAIGYKMTPEQVLYYSENCFGTADAISFKHDFLRIHDLKTGSSKASMNQLLIYEALFCLEYGKKPNEFESELRIYQSNDIVVFKPTVEDIVPIMDKIISSDKIIEKLKAQERM